MNRAAVYLGLLACCGVALALRLAGLADRPMHTDEAVHAVKFGDLWQAGRYEYDPRDYHGPTLYYFTFPFAWLSGAGNFGETTETVYRLVPVCFGVGLILLLPLLLGGLGPTATLSAAALTAVAPVLVYYSRYYIQETLLVFFTLLVFGAGWRFLRSGHVIWALVLGAAGGGMHATKETCLIVWGAAGCAAVLTVLWARCGMPSGTHRLPPRWKKVGGALLLAAVVGMAVSSACFSVGFTNWRGAVDSWLAFGQYLGRADGGSHVHPWYYYLKVLLWTRHAGVPVWTHVFVLVLALLGTLGALRGTLPARIDLGLARFLTLYTLILMTVYSAIPYKTPWCVLGCLHGVVLLAGIGAAAVWGAAKRPLLRCTLVFVALVGGGHLAWQARLATTVYAARPENPFAYAHPVPDVVELGAWAERLALTHADGKRMLTRVITPHSWPLPWYLRRLEQVGYWDTPPDDVDAPLVIAATSLLPEVQRRWHVQYQVFYYGIRPQETVAACVATPVYAAFRERMTTTAATRKSSP